MMRLVPRLKYRARARCCSAEVCQLVQARAPKHTHTHTHTHATGQVKRARGVCGPGTVFPRGDVAGLVSAVRALLPRFAGDATGEGAPPAAHAPAPRLPRGSNVSVNAQHGFMLVCYPCVSACSGVLFRMHCSVSRTRPRSAVAPLWSRNGAAVCRVRGAAGASGAAGEARRAALEARRAAGEAWACARGGHAAGDAGAVVARLLRWPQVRRTCALA